MKRIGLFCMLAIFAAGIVGCGNTGEVTEDQQKDKIKALQNFADKQPGPAREERPQ